MRILFVGDLTPGHCASSLVDGFCKLGIEIRTLDTSSYMRKRIGSKDWVYHKIFHEPSESWKSSFTRRIKEVTADWTPNILFCINTIHIPQEYFSSIDCDLRVHLSFDDVSNPSNLTKDYLDHEKSWDIIFTNKIFNIDELNKRTKAKVIYFDNAYNEKIHFSTIPFANRKWNVGFIGAHRPDRHELPSLLLCSGVTNPIIAGPRWRRYYPLGVPGIVFLPELLDGEYTDVGNQIKIGLCLLNSENRDRITTRSYELPALGQLVVGLETDQHLELLENGKEAFWFKSLDDIFNFCREIQSREREFAQIALAGTRRIKSGKNTYFDRAREMYVNFLSV